MIIISAGNGLFRYYTKASFAISFEEQLKCPIFERLVIDHEITYYLCIIFSSIRNLHGQLLLFQFVEFCFPSLCKR